MQPRLSIVIPVRNGESFVDFAIASAQAVPLADLEILVVDDGSTDGTPALLQSLAERDDRLVVVRRDSDHGAAAARNEAIRRARAPYVCFLDADDALRPTIADRLTWHEYHPDVVMSFADHETLLPDGTIEQRHAASWPRFQRFLGDAQGIVLLGEHGFGLLFGENPVCTTGTMARRDALLGAGGFARDLRQAEDWDLWIRLARRGEIAYSTRPEVLHAVRAGSLMTDVDGVSENVAEVVRRHWREAVLRHPGALMAALSAVQVSRAEQARLRCRNVGAAIHYGAGLLLQPGVALARDFARALAVLAGLRPAGATPVEERARLAREAMG